MFESAKTFMVEAFLFLLKLPKTLFYKLFGVILVWWCLGGKRQIKNASASLADAEWKTNELLIVKIGFFFPDNPASLLENEDRYNN